MRYRVASVAVILSENTSIIPNCDRYHYDIYYESNDVVCQEKSRAALLNLTTIQQCIEVNPFLI